MIVKDVNTKKSKLKYCADCRNNFYNDLNPYGIKECWSLQTAKIKKRKIYMSANDVEPVEIVTLSCFAKQY